jgi:hypothetical protein
LEDSCHGQLQRKQIVMRIEEKAECINSSKAQKEAEDGEGGEG